MTDGAKPATRKSLAKEEALKSFSVVADGWAGAEQNEDETAVPVVRMPETKPAKAELLTPHKSVRSGRSHATRRCGSSPMRWRFTKRRLRALNRTGCSRNSPKQTA